MGYLGNWRFLYNKWVGEGGMENFYMNQFFLKMYKCYLKYVELEFVCIVKDSLCWRSMLCVVFQIKYCEFIFLYVCCDICEKK